MRQNLGQHFLKNTSVLRKIAELLQISAGDAIVEIGPGHGELTSEILDAAGEKEGIKLTAIERDPALAAEIAARFGNNVKLEEGDVLEILPKIIPPGTYKIAGNIPYYLTGHLLRTISELPHKPELTVLTIQREVAERLADLPPHMNRLAAAVQFWAEPKVAGLISRHDFEPPPQVDSATVVLKTKPDLPPDNETAAYYKILAAIFKQPRKTIENNLMEGLGLSRDPVRNCLRKLGISEDLRPQNLKISDISQIAEYFL